MKRMKKWQLWTITGATAAVVLVGGGAMFFLGGGSGTSEVDTTPKVQITKEGSVASSVLLSGNVAADKEQYVYFDATKGDLESVYVNVGDQVGVGEALVQYRSTDAQVAYDAAERAINKVDRQIYELNTYGSSVSLTGDAAADSAAAASSQRSLDLQMSDLQDARANAVDELNKAANLLNSTTVTSTEEGTVVEVNRDVSKSATGTNQTLVHIVSNGNLQVKGELSEYNLANLAVGQEVTITSKVYPDKKWTGKIIYISDYPKEGSAAQAGAAAGGQAGAKYPFTVEITSEIGELKQGFSVNIEVQNKNKAILVPLSSVVTEGDKNYVWVLDEAKKAKKVEVTLGSADAEQQEITSGLTKDMKVITNPSGDLKDGQEVKSYEELD